MIGGKALQITNRNWLVEFTAPANRLTGSRADPSADRGEGVGLCGHRQRLIVTSLGDQTHVEPRVGTDRTCGLTGSSQVLFPLPQPGSPALPGFFSLGDMPAMIFSPGGFTRLLRRGAGESVQRLPAVPLGQVLNRSTVGVTHRSRAGLYANGIGGAFLRADLAANTGIDLNRGEHHPPASGKIHGDGA